MGRSLLAQRDVRLIVAAVGISALGDVLLWVPLTLHLEAMTDSGIAVAALMIALWSPIVLLSPVSGMLVDRTEARRTLIVASLAQAAVAAGLALALDSVAAILVLAALLGVGFSVAQPAEFALVPVIAGSDEESLTQINGYVETARYAGMTAGPVLGGLLVAAGSVEAAMIVNGATFLVVAVAALRLGARRPATVTSDSGDRARDGIVHLFRDRVLALVLATAFASLLFMSASITAEVFFLREDVGTGGFVYGLVFASWTIGMVVGALVVSRRVARSALAAGALVAIAIQGIGLGLPTAWLVAWFAGVAWFIGGVGHGTKNVLVRTLIQERVPDRLHGRAFAAYNGLRNGAELIALAGGGLLVVALGGRVTLALAGGLSLLAGLIGLAIHLARRDREPTSDRIAPPEAEPEPALLDG